MTALTGTDRVVPLRRWLVALVLCGCVSTLGIVRAQEPAPGASSTEAQSDASVEAPATAAEPAPAQAGSTSATQSAPAAPAAPAERDVSERLLIPNFLHDQKDLWLFPTRFSHESHWLPAIVVVGVTAGLLTADAHDAPYFRQTRTFNDFNGAFASNITMSEVLIAPASFYVVGLLDKDPYARKTGLLAAEALGDVTVLSEVIKAVTRQTRPQAIPPYGNFSDTFFNAKGDPFSSGFPSGHTISAFAVATVIAHRYRRHRWVPFVAFGAASLIGFSRITTTAHFPSDVFVGAALGYAVAQFDVLHAPAFGLEH
jgi:membrane-associated phospholipid phosphatase